MKFPGYFLIVAEFIQWGKNNGVPIGPGRGSGAGSLVAYALKITDLDPLKYNLLFERFLNPERVSMPDFDIDFCQEKRELVIQHVKDLYGRDAVSQIATFGTMAAKGAIRDVGRVLDFGYNFCDGISKLIPFKPGKPVSIAEAIEEEPLLKERLENEEEVKQLLELAQQVEGITRNIGMHAGGVLIAPGKLTDFCPLYTQGGDAGVVSQYDKDDVEAVGLVKFDFLGLTTLTILDRAVNYIRALDPVDADFNLETLPLNDRPSYKLLSDAKTVAIFQLESRGMQGMLKDARPDRFEDIIALVALYRPGPMDLIPDFCKRKHGEKFDYPDPRTESILSETYGIMVYQEQVMQMAQIVGGYSLGGADMLRRAMGKKKAEEMAEHREIFRAGAAKDGLSTEKADEIFDLMEKFAGYGFNKSHAAAYALLSYHTAYLKVHHTAAFMAANMSLAMEDTDKIKILVEDSIDVCKLTLLPPDVNESQFRFTPEGPPKSVTGKQVTNIRYGLGGVKGAGQGAIEAIVAARKEGGKFKDLFDFCKRVDRKQINRRTIESLIRAGAMDCFGVDRAILLASVGFAMEVAGQEAAAANQVSLFGGDDSDLVAPPEYVKARPGPTARSWPKKRPRSATTCRATCSTLRAGSAALRQDQAEGPGTVARPAHAVRRDHRRAHPADPARQDPDRRARRQDRRGRGHGLQRAVRGQQERLPEDEFLLVVGKVSEDRFNGGLRITAEKAFDIASSRIQYGHKLEMDLACTVSPAKLAEILRPTAQRTACRSACASSRRASTASCSWATSWRVAPSDALKYALELTLGAKDVAVEY
jgi:DNA polymerase-3 subunit alpha